MEDQGRRIAATLPVHNMNELILSASFDSGEIVVIGSRDGLSALARGLLQAGPGHWYALVPPARVHGNVGAEIRFLSIEPEVGDNCVRFGLESDRLLIAGGRANLEAIGESLLRFAVYHSATERQGPIPPHVHFDGATFDYICADSNALTVVYQRSGVQ